MSYIHNRPTRAEHPGNQFLAYPQDYQVYNPRDLFTGRGFEGDPNDDDMNPPMDRWYHLPIRATGALLSAAGEPFLGALGLKKPYQFRKPRAPGSRRVIVSPPTRQSDEAAARMHNKQMHTVHGNGGSKHQKKKDRKQAAGKARHPKPKHSPSSSSFAPGRPASFVASTVPITRTKVHFEIASYGKDFIRVRGRQLLSTLSTPAVGTGQVFCVMPITPSALSNTKLKDYLQRYEKWRPHKLTVEMVPEVGSTTAGQYTMWIEPDLEDDPVIGSFITWETKVNATGSSPITVWGNVGVADAPIDPMTPPYFCRHSFSNSADGRMSIPGTLVALAGPGMPSSTVLGSLFLTFDITFSLPVEDLEDFAVGVYNIAGNDSYGALLFPGGANTNVPIDWLGIREQFGSGGHPGLVGDWSCINQAASGPSLVPGVYVVSVAIGYTGVPSFSTGYPRLYCITPGDVTSGDSAVQFPPSAATDASYTVRCTSMPLSSALASTAAPHVIPSEWYINTLPGPGRVYGNGALPTVANAYLVSGFYRGTSILNVRRAVNNNSYSLPLVPIVTQLQINQGGTSPTNDVTVRSISIQFWRLNSIKTLDWGIGALPTITPREAAIQKCHALLEQVKGTSDPKAEIKEDEVTDSDTEIIGSLAPVLGNDKLVTGLHSLLKLLKG